ncbi:WYL domain-containing protein [Trueperella pecoris]|uniref:WYL domain-containing protein n=1 Tax=Trueperella pecoris TaxID=2733571 RepID=A0A7M1R553_9ACTO|nr:WYL domain-containing protein [Trueperella pecoris]QOR48605.1 WYL domain-containing protein [Trueperella pecoris]
MADLSLSRKIAILSHLDSHTPTLRQLARRFEKTPAQMRKELLELFVLEIPLAGYVDTPIDVSIPDDADGEVRLIANTTAVSPSLTLAELITLVALIDDLFGVVDSETRANLARLRERLTAGAKEAGYGSALWPAPSVNLSNRISDALNEAMKSRRLIRMRYLKAGEDLHVFDEDVTLAPITITTGARALLVAAKADQLRTYRLDRVAEVTVLDQTFSKALEEDIRARFSAQSPFAGQQVTIRATPAARWVVETLPIDELTESDGLLVIRLTVSSIAWLRTLLIRMGESVVAVEPAHLAELISSQARTYKEAGPCGSGSC